MEVSWLAMRPENLWRIRLVEFLLFFIAVPVGIAVFLPPQMMFSALFAATLVGLVLLVFTPGFQWRELFKGVAEVNSGIVVLTAVITFIASYAIMTWTRPDALFRLIIEPMPRTSAGLPIFLIIALFYPLVSAFPQELIFRPLFFRRYSMLLPKQSLAILLNAFIFSLAHLMYWSWIVAVMTFFGGLLFAWSYQVRKNFAEAVILHSVAGVVLFAVGMGVYFYSGNVVRPF